jgi:DNA-binding MarR family transcriptional regulator
VRTAFDSEDGRVKHAYLTEGFRQMQAEAEQKLRSFESRLVAGFSAEEQETLCHMLERIYNNSLTTEP